MDCTWRSVTTTRGKSCSSVIAVVKNPSLGGTREDTREKSSVITVIKNPSTGETREDTRGKSSEVAIMKQNPPCDTSCTEATRLFKSEMDGENVSKCNAGHQHIRY